MLLIENGGMAKMWRMQPASEGENSRRAVLTLMISDGPVTDSSKTEELQGETLAQPPLSGSNVGLARYRRHKQLQVSLENSKSVNNK